MKARKGPEPLSAVTNSGWTSLQRGGMGGEGEGEFVGLLLLIFSFVVEGGGIKLSRLETEQRAVVSCAWEKRETKLKSASGAAREAKFVQVEI